MGVGAIGVAPTQQHQTECARAAEGKQQQPSRARARRIQKHKQQNQGPCKALKKQKRTRGPLMHKPQNQGSCKAFFNRNAHEAQ